MNSIVSFVSVVGMFLMVCMLAISGALRAEVFNSTLDLFKIFLDK